MNDIDFLFWLSTFVVVAWPVLVTALVYVILRPRITRTRAYFVASVLTGYAISLLTPVAIVFGAMFLGWVGEMAVVAAILWSTPVVVVLATVAAVYWSGRYGATDSNSNPADPA
ncbi:MAG TPA: hypothetical protein VJ925_05855 [Longimicrobiales bacterium]|nr:hypothetical protein [Longimicrobiales bacterium]